MSIPIPKPDQKSKKATQKVEPNELQSNEQTQPETTTPNSFITHSSLKRFLLSHYKFRLNYISGDVEYYCIEHQKEEPINKAIDPLLIKAIEPTEWLLMYNHEFNSIAIRLMDNKIMISKDKLDMLLRSDFVEKYNPLTDYFNGLKNKTDNSIDYNPNIDYIKEYTDAIEIKGENQQRFYNYFRRWCIAAVAQVMDTNFISARNHTCVVLCGKQGDGKTTILNRLCPEILKRHLYVGKIDLEQKDTLGMLAKCFIINIDDQLGDLNKRSENSLKETITKPFIKLRPPYGRILEDYPRVASFVGSVNNIDYLCDPTGNRRFLSFEVEEIDYKKKLNIDYLWFQAYNYWLAGEKYHFTRDEITELNEHNKKFNQVNLEEETLLQYFEKPKRIELAKTMMPTSMILSKLEKDTGLRLSIRKLGIALKEHFEKANRRDKNGKLVQIWFLIEKSRDEINGVVETQNLNEQTIQEQKSQSIENENTDDLPF